MFVPSNLNYGTLPKVVWWFFTTLKRGRGGDEVCVTNKIVLGTLGVTI